ncbi:hypothetical protein P5673_009120 [Acropora cervicornis]|uniref:Uncharacterized protein n=1 Tax=Acropora cervicornis TaxID=6130 RepID=A0AAD9VA33_ACRCE|nr:hypothetical protein P5673_009120 [Acropora cervicornis]
MTRRNLQRRRLTVIRESLYCDPALQAKVEDKKVRLDVKKQLLFSEEHSWLTLLDLPNRYEDEVMTLINI